MSNQSVHSSTSINANADPDVSEATLPVNDTLSVQVDTDDSMKTNGVPTVQVMHVADTIPLTSTNGSSVPQELLTNGQAKSAPSHTSTSVSTSTTTSSSAAGASGPAGQANGKTLPKAIDLSHHLNTMAKSRHPSPIKDIIKFMSIDGMISLAGGLPHPSTFPITELNVSAYSHTAFLDIERPDHPPSGPEQTVPMELVKGQLTHGLDLSQALQYGKCDGLAPLLAFCHDWTTRVLKPAYSDYECLLNCGNTDAWNKVVNMLCEPGDFIIIEAHTYPSSQAMWVPMGCKAVPVEMDGQGIRSDKLEQALRDWPREKKRPRTGSTMLLQRKKEIYEICVKYDVIIVEDDPYYFLQFPSTSAAPQSPQPPTTEEAHAFLNALAPSFLNVDREGRVIRLETFSKVIAPGNRLGYFVCNPLFSERLLRATEVTTQTPSGWSQAIVNSLLHQWGPDGYAIWLANLREQYHIRRDWMCESLEKHFDMRVDEATQMYTAFAKSSHGPIKMFSYTKPTAGMFVWLQLDLSQHPRFPKIESDASVASPGDELTIEIWQEMIAAKVLVSPGHHYMPYEGPGKVPAKRPVGYLRLAFSFNTREQQETGIARLAETLKKSWGLSV